MGKQKYSPEMKKQTVEYIFESGKSATKVAEELHLDKNQVCKWVREYRLAHNLTSYEVEKQIKKNNNDELVRKIKDLERQNKLKDKMLADEREKVEILKKSLHIFMQPIE